MRLIVSSTEDRASQNILSQILERDWEEIDEWEGRPVYIKGDDYICTVDEHHIYFDEVDKKMEDLLDVDVDFDQVVFISKHSSEAGVQSLTVHPIGNYGEAKYGGIEGKLVPTSPNHMTQALLKLISKTEKEGLDKKYDVSFEATHHGPYLETPTYYIEIGSDDSAWKDKNAGKVIADTVLSDEVKNPSKDQPVAICIGGGHYCPRFTELVKSKKIAVGHIVPNWGMKYLTSESLEEAIKKTPGAQFIYFDRSGTSGKERNRVKSWVKEQDLQVIRSSDLESR